MGNVNLSLKLQLRQCHTKQLQGKLFEIPTERKLSRQKFSKELDSNSYRNFQWGSRVKIKK